jgi:hypothetical protein
VTHRLAGYQPRVAVPGVLYRVIDEHLETLLDAAAHHAGGHRVPKFVEQEFRDFITLGILANGFARLRCGYSSPSPATASAHRGARITSLITPYMSPTLLQEQISLKHRG